MTCTVDIMKILLPQAKVMYKTLFEYTYRPTVCIEIMLYLKVKVVTVFFIIGPRKPLFDIFYYGGNTFWYLRLALEEYTYIEYERI